MPGDLTWPVTPFQRNARLYFSQHHFNHGNAFYESDIFCNPDGVQVDTPSVSRPEDDSTFCFS
eukprot:1143247-Pelagomonas_calceolata.AAC.4